MKNGILDGQIELFEVESKQDYIIEQSRKSKMIGYVIKRNVKKDTENDIKNKYLIFNNDMYCWGETIELENVYYSLDAAMDLLKWLSLKEKYKNIMQSNDIFVSEIKLLGTENNKIYFD